MPATGKAQGPHIGTSGGLNDDVPKEAEVELEVWGMKGGRAGGLSGMRAEDLKGWRKESKR